MAWAHRVYEPLLHRAMAGGKSMISGSVALVLASGLLATRMGAEFIPNLDEGDIALHALRIPGTSLTEAIAMQTQLEEVVKSFPEVGRIVAKLGTAEIATDPMPPSVADNFVILKDRKDWPDPSKPKSQLVSEIEQAVLKVPGNNYEFTQPIQMRMNELISGVRADVAVKVYGDDLDQLLTSGRQVERLLKTVPGAADTKLEQATGLPLLSIVPNRDALHRYGLSIADVQDVIAVAMGGKVAGQLFEGDRRFDIVVRLPEAIRTNLETLKTLPVPLPGSSNASEAKAG